MPNLFCGASLFEAGSLQLLEGGLLRCRGAFCQNPGAQLYMK
jgi:hypothetical protein